MREQGTDREGHQKLMALMAVFTLETDFPSQGLACVVGGFGCEHAYEWRARGRKAKGKGNRLSNKTASHASYVNEYSVFKICLKRVLKQTDCVFV